MTSPAERILSLTNTLASLEADRKKLLGAIGPVQQGYADGKRLPQRPLTQMENAAIKRASEIEHRITPIEEERDKQVAFFLSQLAGTKVDHDEAPEEDPEVLLRASLRMLADISRQLDDDMKTPDLRVLMLLLLTYIRDLKTGDDDDDG